MMKMKQSVSQIGSRDPYNNIRLLKVPPPSFESFGLRGWKGRPRGCQNLRLLILASTATGEPFGLHSQHS